MSGRTRPESQCNSRQGFMVILVAHHHPHETRMNKLADLHKWIMKHSTHSHAVLCKIPVHEYINQILQAPSLCGAPACPSFFLVHFDLLQLLFMIQGFPYCVPAPSNDKDTSNAWYSDQQTHPHSKPPTLQIDWC